MINLLLADDEPLVQAGIKSMINWEEQDIHIVGTASNGAAAYEMISRYSPEIVITDIKMPIMSGLELVKKCREEGRTLPVFILLTSYEEFQFVKEALTYEVVDYLVKLELTPESLQKTIARAVHKVRSLQEASPVPKAAYGNIDLLREQFFTRLVFNLFESEEQFFSQAGNLKLDFDYAAFAACYVEICSAKLSDMRPEQQLSLYTNSLQVTSELLSRYAPCHVLSLDTRHFCILFFLEDANALNYRNVIQRAVEQVSAMLFNYYSVTIHVSVGAPVRGPMLLAASYQDARQIFSQTSAEKPLLFFEDVPASEPLKNVFNLSLFKEDIRRAYAEYDEQALYDIFTSIMELFEGQTAHYVQALDAAGNILYLSLSLLNDGEQLVSGIFEGKRGGYRSLYELTNVEQILDWLRVLRDGLCDRFSTYNKDYKNHIVINVRKYIAGHIREKLTLNKVAEVFNISPNYLSVLFSKYNDVGFTDFINQTKIETAKEMMADGDYKIYEISDILGFESAFYFSRVFKKITGVSPRDYINKNP